MNNIKNNFILENLHKKGIINESYEGDFLKNLKGLLSEWNKNPRDKNLYTKIINQLSSAKVGYGLVYIYIDRFENNSEKILLFMCSGELRWKEYYYNSEGLVYFPETLFGCLCTALDKAPSEGFANLHYVNSSTYKSCCESSYGGFHDFNNTKWVINHGSRDYLEVLKNSRGGYIVYKLSSLNKESKEEVANFSNKEGLVKYLAKNKCLKFIKG